MKLISVGILILVLFAAAGCASTDTQSEHHQGSHSTSDKDMSGMSGMGCH